MTQPRPPVLSEPERSQILNQVVQTKVISQGGVVRRFNESGVVSVGRFGPQVTKWGTTWAEVTYKSPITHPALIWLSLVYSIFTCGLYLPWWFYRTFKRPNVWTLSIDEYGYEHWTQHEISQAQRVLRYVLLAVVVGVPLLWFIITGAAALMGVGSH